MIGIGGAIEQLFFPLCLLVNRFESLWRHRLRIIGWTLASADLHAEEKFCTGDIYNPPYFPCIVLHIFQYSWVYVTMDIVSVEWKHVKDMIALLQADGLAEKFLTWEAWLTFLNNM